jgi:signal transduction histidine kinase
MLDHTLSKTRRNKRLADVPAQENGQSQSHNRKQLEKAILDVSEFHQYRIGHDLHDGLCQELTGIALLVQTMHHRVQFGQQVTESATAEVSALVQLALKHACTLARGLQPVNSVANGLAVALKHLADDTAGEFAILCQFRCPRLVEIGSSIVATHLYRIAEACVREAVLHARAKRIIITLSRSRGGIRLAVSDDGMRAQQLIIGGNMVCEMIEHRARMIGGSVTILPSKVGGVRVTCHVRNFEKA